MALETGTYINSLNASNPASTDGLAQADDHIRLLKSTIKSTLPNVTGAITATQAELNLLDGVTATTAELNALDGITSTVAELNILDGVTSTAAELNILDGLTATTDELNKLDGLTASTAELNYVDGVTSSIQSQLNTNAASVSAIVGLATSLWEAGTNTAESLVSPAKLTSAISAYLSSNVQNNGIGQSQSWVNVTSSRSGSTSYENTTSRPIQVVIQSARGTSVQASTNGSTWVTIATVMGNPNNYRNIVSFIVPVDHYYRITGDSSYPVFENWSELR